MENLKNKINTLDWYCKDGKAKNKTQIFKGVGKKFDKEALEVLYAFFISLKGIESVYIQDGYLDIYFDNMIIYPSIYCLKQDNLL